MSKYTTVSIPSDKREEVTRAQDALEQKLGFRPGPGPAVIHACRLVAEEAAASE